MLGRRIGLGLAIAWAVAACGEAPGEATDRGVDHGVPARPDAATDTFDAGMEPPDGGDAGMEAPDLGPQPELTLGWGFAEMVPVEDGEAVELVRGRQGSLHVEPAVRIENLDAEEITLILRGSDPATGAPLTERWVRDLTARTAQFEGTTITKLFNWLVFDERCQPDVVGRRVRIEAAVARVGGTTLASDSVEVVIVDEETPDTACGTGG